MAQFVREFLPNHPEGWTRMQLKAVLREQPEFEAQFARNPGAYYNVIQRLRERGEIEDRDGLLYATGRTSRRIALMRGSSPD